MIVPVNKKRVPVALIIGLALLVLLIFLVIEPLKKFNEEGFHDEFYLGSIIGALLSISILTILSALDYVKILFDKNAGLEITDKGIIDNLSIFSVGEISWQEITEIKVATTIKVSVLTISVKNPQVFCSRINFLKRVAIKRLIKKFGTPVFISQTRVDYNLNDLKDLLIKAHQNNTVAK